MVGVSHSERVSITSVTKIVGCMGTAKCLSRYIKSPHSRLITRKIPLSSFPYSNRSSSSSCGCSTVGPESLGLGGIKS